MKKPSGKKDPARSFRARAGGQTLKCGVVGALPIINRVIERMRLAEFLETYLPAPDSRSKVSTEQGLLVLLRNILLSREPIYGLGEWAESFAADLLGLGPCQAKNLNDDCVGRCLERLFDADYPSMIIALMTHVVKEFDVELDQLHNDSTTISFHGSYDDAKAGASQRGKPTLAVTHGHNKDHRPDLKQLLFILTVARDGGLPIYFTAADGNVTDDTTHRNTWDLMCQLVGARDFLYVADSKLATAGNMAYIHQGGGRFVTLLPRTRAEHAAFRTSAQERKIEWKELWTRSDDDGEILDVYRIYAQPAITSEGYRLLWIHSMGKQENDALGRSKRMKSALGKLSKLGDRLRSPRTRFRQRTKVASAVSEILDHYRCNGLIEVEITELEEESYKQETPGRPGKDTRYIRSTSNRFKINNRIEEAAVGRDATTDGVFALVSNDRDLSDPEVLKAYKKQPKVEKRFSQFKSDYEVAPVYLKNVARIEALMCTYFLALLTESLIEREMRLAMVAEGLDSIPLYPEGRSCKRPCTRRVLDLFGNIQRHELTGPEQEPLTMITDLSAIQRQVLGLLKVPRRSYGQPVNINR
ncbi:MAG: IS1634 family transposase [Dehalococcoidales bacterium]